MPAQWASPVAAPPGGLALDEEADLPKRKLLSLFTGAGGLDLGLEAAGFDVQLCVEIDPDSRQTLVSNRPKWKLAEPGDVHQLTPKRIMAQADVRPGELTLLAGGPPCQPFSKSGYWVNGDAARLSDPRASTFSAYLSLVEAALPEVVLLENVKGIAYDNKDEGLRLLRNEFARINDERKANYQPAVIVLHAAEHGVPQVRERVFVIAHRNGTVFSEPAKTHAPPEQLGNDPSLEPYLTAWDAIGDLDSDVWDLGLHARGKWADLLPSIPEGENYQWHTERLGGEPLFGWRTRFWSFLLKLAKDRPSWTIQAQPGPSTGPFHWRSRQLSIRELARLQTFPDDYHFVGERRSVQRQIGNAVPPAIGELLGREIRAQLLGGRPRRTISLLPERRGGCPGPEPVAPVPRKFLKQRGKHKAHPGAGKGPGAQRRVRDGRPHA